MRFSAPETMGSEEYGQFQRPGDLATGTSLMTPFNVGPPSTSWRQAVVGAKDLWTRIATVYAKDLGQLRLMFELFVKRSASLTRTDDWEHSSSTPDPMEFHVHRLQTSTIGYPGDRSIRLPLLKTRTALGRAQTGVLLCRQHSRRLSAVPPLACGRPTSWDAKQVTSITFQTSPLLLSTWRKSKTSTTFSSC